MDHFYMDQPKGLRASKPVGVADTSSGMEVMQEATVGTERWNKGLVYYLFSRHGPRLTWASSQRDWKEGGREERRERGSSGVLPPPSDWLQGCLATAPILTICTEKADVWGEGAPGQRLGWAVPLPCGWLSPASQYVDSPRSLMDRRGGGGGAGPFGASLCPGWVGSGERGKERGAVWG